MNLLPTSPVPRSQKLPEKYKNTGLIKQSPKNDFQKTTMAVRNPSEKYHRGSISEGHLAATEKCTLISSNKSAPPAPAPTARRRAPLRFLSRPKPRAVFAVCERVPGIVRAYITISRPCPRGRISPLLSAPYAPRCPALRGISIFLAARCRVCSRHFPILKRSSAGATGLGITLLSSHPRRREGVGVATGMSRRCRGPCAPRTPRLGRAPSANMLNIGPVTSIAARRRRYRYRIVQFRGTSVIRHWSRGGSGIKLWRERGLRRSGPGRLFLRFLGDFDTVGGVVLVQ